MLYTAQGSLHVHSSAAATTMVHSATLVPPLLSGLNTLFATTQWRLHVVLLGTGMSGKPRAALVLLILDDSAIFLAQSSGTSRYVKCCAKSGHGLSE